MKEMTGSVPGFKYSPKTHTAHFSLYVPKSSGKVRRERTVKASSRKEALELWMRFRDELSGAAADDATVVAASPALVAPAPLPAAGNVPTFRAFIASHLEKICARLAPKTFATYQTIATSRLEKFFGDKVLTDIHANDVDAFVGDMLIECSPAYVNASIRTLKALLNHAVKQRVILASPLTEKIKFEDEELPELELSDAERIAFLAAFDDEAGFRNDIASRRREPTVKASAHFKEPRAFGFGKNPDSAATGVLFEHFQALKPVFVVALETGLRKSDLLNLQWPQVDLEGGKIRVRMKKTKKWAVTPISQLCREALEMCRQRAPQSRFVFVMANGERVAEIAVRRAFLRAKRVAGISRRFRFHDLRHTAACTLASSGVSLQIIQTILGHTTIKMTERYVRVNEAAVVAARSALDAHNAKLGLGR